jgi:hypothetical protein
MIAESARSKIALDGASSRCQPGKFIGIQGGHLSFQVVWIPVNGFQSRSNGVATEKASDLFEVPLPGLSRIYDGPLEFSRSYAILSADNLWKCEPCNQGDNEQANKHGNPPFL